MRPTSNGGDTDYGLGSLFLICIGIVFMITINGGVVDLFLSGWVMDRPTWLEDKRVLMAIGQVAPFLLLVGEFWILDFLLERVRATWSRGSQNKP